MRFGSLLCDIRKGLMVPQSLLFPVRRHTWVLHAVWPLKRKSGVVVFTRKPFSALCRHRQSWWYITSSTAEDKSHYEVSVMRSSITVGSEIWLGCSKPSLKLYKVTVFLDIVFHLFWYFAATSSFSWEFGLCFTSDGKHSVFLHCFATLWLLLKTRKMSNIFVTFPHELA